MTQRTPAMIHAKGPGSESVLVRIWLWHWGHVILTGLVPKLGGFMYWTMTVCWDAPPGAPGAGAPWGGGAYWGLPSALLGSTNPPEKWRFKKGLDDETLGFDTYPLLQTWWPRMKVEPRGIHLQVPTGHLVEDTLFLPFSLLVLVSLIWSSWTTDCALLICWH